MNPSTGIELEGLSKSGQAPKSRLNDAKAVDDLVRQLIRADERRAKVRSRVKGLVDGNPPYSPTELKRLGQSYRTNCNFREAEAFMNLGLSAFYDVFSEVPHYATIRIEHGDRNESERYSQIITEEFDRLQKQDTDFDYLVQSSQYQMVLYGTGPLVFEDSLDWRTKSIRAGELLVPDQAKSNINDWSLCVVRNTYQVHELYQFIRNEKAASVMGWDVAATRKAIMDAMPEQYSNNSNNWEWHQQQIRNNDLSHSAKCNKVKISHVFYREFPTAENTEGAISHVIIDERADKAAFMFRKVGRFSGWQECLHPMFYDKGDGTYHSIKGMGVKMYSSLELKNRLRCANIDSAFLSTSLVVQPDGEDSLNKTAMVNVGNLTIMPPGYNLIQRQIAGVLDPAMAMEREMQNNLQSNLSQYTPNLDKQGGNPRTATEIEAIVAQQSVLGKTQLSRYYEQLDGLFAERYRRASNLNLTKDVPGGRAAIKFQKRCFDRGCPRDCFSKSTQTLIRATRSIGQGSSFQRKQILSNLLGISGMLPETGRDTVLRDYVASLVGQGSMERILPEPELDYNRQEQEQEAARENIAFRVGGIIPVTDKDNHVIHAQTHLEFGVNSANAVQEGGDMAEVAATLQALMPHIQGHLEKLSKDDSRKDILKLLMEQTTELAEIAGELIKNVQQQQQQQAAMQQQQQQAEAEMQSLESGADPKDQIAAMRAEREESRRDAAVSSDMKRKEKKTNQDMAIKDAKAAVSI